MAEIFFKRIIAFAMNMYEQMFFWAGGHHMIPTVANTPKMLHSPVLFQWAWSERGLKIQSSTCSLHHTVHHTVQVTVSILFLELSQLSG